MTRREISFCSRNSLGTTFLSQFPNLREISIESIKSEISLGSNLLSAWIQSAIKRRERDLNSRGTNPRDFQSRAIPGYAISAAKRPSDVLPFMVTIEEYVIDLRSSHMDIVKSAPPVAALLPLWLSGIAPHW